MRYPGDHDKRWHEMPRAKREGGAPPYKKGELASRVLNYVSEVERSQSYLYERFLRLACLYDPYFARLYGGYGYGGSGGDDGGRQMRVTENAVASNVDTVVSVVAAADVRPRILTDDGDFSTKRQAARQSWYAEALGKKLGAHQLGVEGFKDAALKGTGLAKVWPDFHTGQIRAERVLVDDIIVDESATRSGAPRQLHQRAFVDRDALIAAYAKHAEEIRNAQRNIQGTGTWDMWAEYRPIDRSQVVVIESWYLPYGTKGTENYSPGRWTLCIDNCELFDKEWHHDYFPFAVMRWTTRAAGWYGIGGAERIAGHQRRLNKMNWQVDRRLDQFAMPTTYVHHADAALAVKSRNEFGTIGVYKVAIPKTVIPPAVSGETYARLDRIKDSSFEEFGVSRLAAGARKPPGMDSGVALREYRDQTTQRFSTQERGFERFVLDIHWLALCAAKELADAGIEPPVVIKKLARSRKRLRWEDVDTGEIKVQLYAASTLSRTPSGRQQSVMEYAQAGIFSIDEARKLLGPFDSLDLEATLSVYQAAMDSIQMAIEEILDGEWIVPEPYDHLQLSVRMFEAAYQRARVDGAPDEVLDDLRLYIDLAANMLAPPEPEQDYYNAGPRDVGAVDPAAVDPAMAAAAAPPVSQLAVNMIPGAEGL